MLDENGMDEKTRKEFELLENAARPLAEYIRKYHTPMTTAIVTGARVEILQGVIGTNRLADIQDPSSDS